LLASALNRKRLNEGKLTPEGERSGILIPPPGGISYLQRELYWFRAAPLRRHDPEGCLSNLPVGREAAYRYLESGCSSIQSNACDDRCLLIDSKIVQRESRRNKIYSSGAERHAEADRPRHGTRLQRQFRNGKHCTSLIRRNCEIHCSASGGKLDRAIVRLYAVRRRELDG
jgi:hypothetical protein